MSWLCTSSSASSFHYGKVPELFRKYFRNQNWKTEKLKNCFFQRDPGRDSPYGFSFLVFQFFSFGSGTIWKTETLDAYKQIVVLASMSLCTSSSASSFHYGKVPELFRNQNWKTEKLFFPEIQEEILHMDSVFQFFSFSVFQFFSFGSGTIWKTETLDAYKQIVVLASMSWLCTSSSASSFQYGKVPELFRNTSGTKTEKLKNCFFQRDPGRDSPSVFQFFSFRNYSGIFPEKLKNWKTEFSRDIQAEILHMDSVFQFFAE